MLFSNLPPHSVTLICGYLDNKSLFNALKVFRKWTDALTPDSKFMNKFQLNLTEPFCRKWRIHDYPNIAIKNVSIGSEDSENFNPNTFFEALWVYKKSIQNVKLEYLRVDRGAVAKLLEYLANLTHLTLDEDVEIHEDYEGARLKLPGLKTLTAICNINPCNEEVMDYYEYTDENLRLFEHNQSIEKLHLEFPCRYPYEYTDEKFNDFVSTLPKLKHLVMIENGYCDRLIGQKLPAKLETLKISQLSSLDYDLNFLRSQKDTLKDLSIVGIIDGSHIDEFIQDTKLMMFIFNEMNLKNFSCCGTDLILNYERQPAYFELIEKTLN